MNLREGTRRLALLLGAFGAIAGGLASYVELQTVLPQRAAHRHFEQLANSKAVQNERKARQSPPDFLANAKPVKHGPPPGVTLSPISSGPPPGVKLTPQYYDPDTGKPLPTAPSTQGSAKQYYDPDTGKPLSTPPAKAGEPNDWQTVSGTPAPAPQQGNPWDRPTDTTAPTAPPGYTLDAPPKPEDGQTLYPTPAPSAWLYLLIALFPVLGFFVPWGAIRAVVWVVAGFIKPAP